MSWLIVPNLEDLRRELDATFPNRDHASDGGIGDTSHAAGKSSHNPDETGNPEFSDHDGRDEVRARDFDKDLNHPTVTAEDVVQHLLAGARSGRFWWLRYIIYNKRIWAKSGGWKQQAYTGVNPHDHHFHVNSDYTQAADTVSGVDYGLKELTNVVLDDNDAKKVAWWLLFGTPIPGTEDVKGGYQRNLAQVVGDPWAIAMKGKTLGGDPVPALSPLAAVLRAVAERAVDPAELATALAPPLAAALAPLLPAAKEVTPATLAEAFRGLLTGTTS